jgi:hypothetical protein
MPHALVQRPSTIKSMGDWKMESLPAGPRDVESGMLKFIALLLLSCTLNVSAQDIENLLTQLGGEGFRTRKAAELAMKELPREALPELQQVYETTDDPEIKVRLGRIIQHIMTSPGKIPTAFKVLDIENHRAFKNAAASWQETQTIATLHTNGNAGTGGDFAQSFVPRCETIAAIEVCTYALSDGYGWMRLDLVLDDAGNPSDTVLARSWVKISKDHKFPHGGYVLHDFPDTPVKPDQRYWIIYYDYPDEGANATFLNFGLSIKEDAYPGGNLWRAQSQTPSKVEDVKFRIYSKSVPFMPYRTPTEEELKSLPAMEDQNISWSVIQQRNN